MKEFIVVLKNEYDNLVMFKVKAPCRQILYNSDKTCSNYLIDKMIKDTYIFAGYNREQLHKCIIILIEEETNVIEL